MKRKTLFFISWLVKAASAPLMPSLKATVVMGVVLSLLTHSYYDCKGADLSEYRGLGPIPIINQAPTLLPFLQPKPDRAATLRKGTFDLSLTSSITNTLVSQTADRYRGLADMETLGAALDFKAGLDTGLELGISLPFYLSYSGFMDKTILDVEETFGKPRTVRKNENRNEYRYRVQKDDRVFLGGSRTSSGAGDASLFTKWSIIKESEKRPHLSARLNLKLPTGSRERSLSSGKPDAGLGLLA